jgi:hypothetical protein
MSLFGKPRLGDAWEWQQDQLSRLSRKPFSELSALPNELPIQAPANLRGLDFAICKAACDNGGVRISVRARRRSLLIFVATSDPSFEMTADGKLIDSGRGGVA